MERLLQLSRDLLDLPDCIAAEEGDADSVSLSSVQVVNADRQSDAQVWRVRQAAYACSIHPEKPSGVVDLAPLHEEEFNGVGQPPTGNPTAIQHKNNSVTLCIKQQHSEYIVTIDVPMLEDVKLPGGICRHIPDAIIIGELTNTSGIPATDITYEFPNAETRAHLFLTSQSTGLKLPMIPPGESAMKIYVELQTLALLPEKKIIGSWFSPIADCTVPSVWVETNRVTKPYLQQQLRFPLAKHCRVNATTAGEWQTKFEKMWSNIHAAKNTDTYTATPNLTCTTMTYAVDVDTDATPEYLVKGMLDWTGFRIFIPA